MTVICVMRLEMCWSKIVSAKLQTLRYCAAKWNYQMWVRIYYVLLIM